MIMSVTLGSIVRNKDVNSRKMLVIYLMIVTEMQFVTSLAINVKIYVNNLANIGKSVKAPKMEQKVLQLAVL